MERPPIKHALTFRWKFRESSSLSMVAESLARNHFYTVRGGESVLVATSISRPLAVIFVFVLEHSEGGSLILIQTREGWYNYEQLNHYMRIFAREAGVDIQVEEPNL